jgi:hypothetical protein
MGTWVHTESESFDVFVTASLARARDSRPWAATPSDELLFRGTELVRALVLGKLVGSVKVVPQSEGNVVASVTVRVDPSPETAPQRLAAASILGQTNVLLSQGKVNSADLRTSSHGADVGIWPIVVGVCVVDLATMGFLGYCVHEYTKTVDNAAQRAADFAKLKEIDAHALMLVKQHTDREAAAGKQLALDEATRAALAGTAQAQKSIAEKQTVSSPPSEDGFSFSPAQIAAGAALALAALVLLKK